MIWCQEINSCLLHFHLAIFAVWIFLLINCGFSTFFDRTDSGKSCSCTLQSFETIIHDKQCQTTEANIHCHQRKCFASRENKKLQLLNNKAKVNRKTPNKKDMCNVDINKSWQLIRMSKNKIVLYFFRKPSCFYCFNSKCFRRLSERLNAPFVI